MTPPPACLEDVLEAFSFEVDEEPRALARYLCDYPQFADALVRFSLELRRPLLDEDVELGAGDLAAIEAGLARLAPPAATRGRNLFAGQAPAAMAAAARSAGIPRAVLLGIRDGGVKAASLPGRWASRLAAALGGSLDELLASVARSPVAARAYKSDAKLEAPEPVTFEQALRDSLVPEDEIAALLADRD